MEKIKSFFWRKKIILVLSAIILLAIFLRLHNTQYWLRFNDDQVRDALVVDRMVSGEEFPLLGPKAGGTHFKLGPAFYYIEYLSAATFQKSPIDLAYPIIFFSVLSILLFFYIGRKIFRTKISLILTFLFSISAFAIKYSRFAWNPNIMPFFILLLFLSFHQLNRKNLSQKSRWIWSAIIGITIGVSLQLHTTLLFIVPIFCILLFLHQFIKKSLHPAPFLMIIGLIFLTNLPSIIYEVRSDGKNFAAFSQGFLEKTTTRISLPEKIQNSMVCSVQSHTAILSGVLLSDDCDMFSKNNRKLSWFWPITLGSFLFFFGGLFLFVKYFFQEKNADRKYLLGIILLYLFLFSSLLIPLGEEVSLRFFIALLFSPFLFLGFWLKMFFSWSKKIALPVAAIAVILIIASNAIFFQKIFLSTDEGKFFGGNRLGDIDPVAQYIASDVQKNPEQKPFVFSFGAARPLEYLIEKRGVREIQHNSSLEELSQEKTASTISYVIDNDSSGKDKNQDSFPGFEIVEEKDLGKYTVFKITPKK
ncbi:MAG TPA: hypothetical protein DIC35_01035 [Candidatus Moranbacteria bacterium]|nr:hypothetical protein [Candidatus Moranbacteria bacterium]